MASSEVGKRSRFITFEGGEGAGKTTQVGLLAESLRRAGEQVTVTREPGGTLAAEKLRALLLHDPETALGPKAEALVFYAARQDHLEKVIRPALEKGEFVLCDRFHDSTRAYQGAGGRLQGSWLSALDALVVGDTQPGLTFFLDLDPQRGLARAAGRGQGQDRFETEDLSFHERLRSAFLDIARAEPDRMLTVDATGEPDAIAAHLRNATSERYGIAL